MLPPTLGWALLLTALVPAASFAAPAFTTRGPLSTDTGYVSLEWEGGGTLTLEQSGSPAMEDARVVYSGANHALFLSGLADGTYYFTLQDENGARSAPLELSVTHQSLAQALWLSAIGALVFLSVLAVIVRGARDEQ